MNAMQCSSCDVIPVKIRKFLIQMWLFCILFNHYEMHFMHLVYSHTPNSLSKNGENR